MRNTRQITASISRVARSGEKFSTEVQALLIEIAGHMVAHKEPSLGQKLLAAFEGKKQATAIASWLAANTVFTKRGGQPAINESRWLDLTKGFQRDANGVHMEAAEMHMATLERGERWDHEPDAEPKEKAIFDAVEGVERLLKRIAAASKNGAGQHLDLERYLRAAMEQYAADTAALKGGV